MPKINLDFDYGDFERYGGKVKTRHNKKKQIKVKRPSSINSKSKKTKRNTNKYE